MDSIFLLLHQTGAVGKHFFPNAGLIKAFDYILAVKQKPEVKNTLRCAGFNSLLDLDAGRAAAVPQHGHRQPPLAVGGGRHGDQGHGVRQRGQHRLVRVLLQHGCEEHLLVALPTGREKHGGEGDESLNACGCALGSGPLSTEHLQHREPEGPVSPRVLRNEEQQQQQQQEETQLSF